jgi:hypothetical protein
MNPRRGATSSSQLHQMTSTISDGKALKQAELMLMEMEKISFQISENAQARYRVSSQRWCLQQKLMLLLDISLTSFRERQATQHCSDDKDSSRKKLVACVMDTILHLLPVKRRFLAFLWCTSTSAAHCCTSELQLPMGRSLPLQPTWAARAQRAPW